jgi:hypothetical protein
MDLVIEFLLYTVWWLWRDYRTRHWPTAKAEVQSSRLSGSSVIVTYTYQVDNQRLTGIHKRSFATRTSAEEYAKRFAPKWPLVVRYRGADPTDSLVLGDDQANPPVWATRYRDVDA